MNIAIQILGGLGIFLYGMNLMGDGLQRAAGNRLKRFIEIMTRNIFFGVLFGAVVTMLIQSSSVTTVMVVGFVNAGMMNLYQATGVIMGANIGTTITAQLIAFNLGDYAPIAIVIGLIFWLKGEGKKRKSTGEVLIGFGLLFIGLDMMGAGLAPLASNPEFTKLLLAFENPILAILAGFVLTTIVQSSSASVGILQAFASQGLVNMNLAFPILFGENIGTTTTAIISSFNANKTAKRAALIHFLFNVVGMLIFMTGLRWPVQKLVMYLSPDNVARQIANANSLFKIINVAIQLPFAKFLVKVSTLIIPGEDEKERKAQYLDERVLNTPYIALGLVDKEVHRMYSLVYDNLNNARKSLIAEDYDDVEKVFKLEKTIDALEKELMDYLLLLSKQTLAVGERDYINTLLFVLNDIERIGDHAENIAELAEIKLNDNVYFTDSALDELYEMFDLCLEGLLLSRDALRTNDIETVNQVLEIEDKVDELEEINRLRHFYRLENGGCSIEAGVLYLDIISNLERISDHSTNIVRYVESMIN